MVARFRLGHGPGRSCLGETSVTGDVKVRVPNPAKPRKERLDAPPERLHRVKKRYRRRPKHPEAPHED